MRRPSLTRKILRGIIAATSMASREDFTGIETVGADIEAAKDFALRFDKWQCHQTLLRNQEKQGGKS